MRVHPQSDSGPKAACSVSDMASRCGLSRARFYELIKLGVMPPPCCDVQTRRPLYPEELQELCLHIRQTNTGFDGRYVIFNTRRSTAPRANVHLRQSKAKPPESVTCASIPEMVAGLRTLGVTASESQISSAVAACYPDGVGEGQVAAAIRTVFRHLRRLNAA